MENKFGGFKSYRLSQLFKAAVALYTGEEVKKLDFVELKSTLSLPVEFAIQVELTNKEYPVIQFLVCQGYEGPNPSSLRISEMTPEQLVDILEEAHFTSWPPKLR
jgi:hypothetical protein